MGVSVIQAETNEKISVATLDEAMLLTGFGTYNILHMLMCGMMLMGVILQNLSLGYIMPAAQCDLDLSMEQRGWLAALPFAAMILTSIMWGWLGDTRGRRPIMLYSMLLSGVFSLLTSFSPDIISFAILEFISSIFTSGASAIVYTYLGEFNNLRHRDKMVAFGSSFIGMGTVVLPGISWLVLTLDFYYPIGFLNIAYRPWRLLVFICAMPYIIGAVFLMFAPESPKFLNEMGRHEECLEVLKTIYSINKRQPKDAFPVKSLIVEKQTSVKVERNAVSSMLKSLGDQTVPLFKRPFLKWVCLTCFVQFGIFGTTNGFYIWFPLIFDSLANHAGGDTRICDILTAAKVTASNTTLIECIDTINTETFQRSIYIGLVFLSMYFIVIILLDFVDKKVILVVVLFITGVCCISAHLVSNSIVGVVLLAVFQMAGACVGMMTAVAVGLFPTKYRAMAICLCMMMGRGGSMVGSNVVGLLLQTHCEASFYICGGLLITNSLLCLTLPRRQTIPKPSKESQMESATDTHEPI